MLSLKDQARLNTIRRAWREKPEEFAGPEYYAAKANVLLNWKPSMRNKQAANTLPRLTITLDELANPETEPVGLFARYTIQIQKPEDYGFYKSYGAMTVREYVAAFKNTLYVGLGIPDIAAQMQLRENNSPLVSSAPIDIVILGEIT
jgi:hypothetical protein